MKNTVLIFLSLALTLVCFDNAIACWCRNDPEETNTPEKLKKVVVKELRNSDAVFSGEVIEIGKSDIKFKVKKVWKGDVAETEITISRWYYTKIKNETYIECSFQSFEVDKSYLLYADLFENRLQVYDCSRSRFFDKAESDLKVLDSLKADELQK